MSAPARWREIEQVVASALELPAGDRDHYVDRVCGSDTPLSTEVRMLIRAYEQAGDFLDPVTYHEKWTGVQPQADALEGKFAGAYRIVRAIGRGGMGMVYLARRDDDQFEKEVAVKLVNPALYGPGLMRRFRDERQILARLEHPCIARLLDAGVTADGIPFIVMEYVDGVPIHEYCRDRSVRERLSVFLEVCAAVHFAHRNLIVHRDLKPSNILVTAEGTPKLLDFGIARMLAGPGAETAGVTTPLAQALTPDYASPEQLCGGNLTTATDVYSLGVLLYELLSGERPCALSGKPLDEVVDILCRQEAPRLTATAAGKSRKFGSQLRGDLEHIVAKALRREAAERYASAEQLALDIERHLNGLPIEARRGSLRYTAGKYVRRYKFAVSAAVVALLLASGGVAAIIRQAGIAERERAVAERRFNEVRQLARSMIFELHDGIAPLPGSLPVRKLMVTRALEFLDRLAREAHSDRGLTLEIAQAFLRIGEVQGGLTMASFGDHHAALASFTRARDLLLPLHKANPGDPEAGNVLGKIYYRLQGISVGLHDYAKALDQCALAEATYSAVLRAHPANDAAKLGLAAVYFGHAVTLRQMDREPLSGYWQKSLDIYRTLIARGSREPNLERDYARSLTFYATQLVDVGRARDALQALHQSQEINQRRLAANPADRDAATDLTMSYGGLGYALKALGRDDEVLAWYQKALSVLQQVSDASPQDAYLRERVAFRHFSIGEELVRMKQGKKALSSFREAIRINDELAARTPPVAFSRGVLARSWLNIGRIEQTSGRPAAACDALRRSLRIYEEMKKQGSARNIDHQAGSEAATILRSCARVLS